MNKDFKYDLAIVGGGLAGLALSIQIAKSGYSVILFEKEKYPFHRVCGEYISYESWNFIQSLGLDIHSLNVSHIKKLLISDIKGNFLQQELPLGGFGISRYILDHQLAQLAIRKGVEVREQTRVNSISFANEEFILDTGDLIVKAKTAVACFGKRSNLDIKWKRSFIDTKSNKLNNYIGIKYHIRYRFPDDVIALHNFTGGYCGISKIEGDKFCLCYLTSASNLQKNRNNIFEMERNILSSNPHLKKIFDNCEMLWQEPVTISQISFTKKNLIHDHVLMIGDAAGMITPLCGNGMSMALHASKIAFTQIQNFLEKNITREQMEKNYASQWNKLFSKRMKAGRLIQKLMLNKWMISFIIRIGRIIPGISKFLIRQTHGQPF